MARSHPGANPLDQRPIDLLRRQRLRVPRASERHSDQRLSRVQGLGLPQVGHSTLAITCDDIDGAELETSVPVGRFPLRRSEEVLVTGTDLAEVAAQVGFSLRQLNRRSLASFGYGPKVLGRVMRLQRALASARGGMSLVQASLAAGYGDQAHFAHEVRALTGQSASQLVGSAANRSTPLPSGSRSVA